MSEGIAGLRSKMDSAVELQAVVRTMKSVAASNISRYEQSVRALSQYYHSVELGLRACFRESDAATASAPASRPGRPQRINAVVFGSDQGLVGSFNEVLAEETIKVLGSMREASSVWAVGERVHARLAAAGLAMQGLFKVPDSSAAITLLVGQILVACEARQNAAEVVELRLFYNRYIADGAYEPVSQRLLPLDGAWRQEIVRLAWPNANLVEVMGRGNATLRSFIREHLFVSIFRACAESLASENASRLVAMQRADRNIDELLQSLRSKFNYLRQEEIDEELFDVSAGFEALSGGSGDA